MKKQDKNIEKLKEEKLFFHDQANKLHSELIDTYQENEQQKRDIKKLQEQIDILFDLLDK